MAYLGRMYSEIRKNEAGSISIPEGTVHVGDVTDTCDVRVAGKLIGNIETAGRVMIDLTGVVCGNIKATEIFCSGRLKGDTEVANRINLEEGGEVDGYVQMRKLLSHGGRVNGQVVGAPRPVIVEEPSPQERVERKLSSWTTSLKLKLENVGNRKEE